MSPPFRFSQCEQPNPEGTDKIRSHPYYDPKTIKEEPTWYMVNVEFKSRIQYPPTLALIKHLASLSSLPGEIEYIGKEGLEAIGAMQLVNRGRLSESSIPF
jgi:protein phosphatase-4 regulatory subunit 3